MDYYNVHLRKTSDPVPINKNKLERGMVVKMKYRKDKETKLYLIFILNPKFPKSVDGKLHALSMSVIPPNKFLELAEDNNEIMAESTKVRKLDIAKIKIDEASKQFYQSEIKVVKQLKVGYRTFDLDKIQSMHVVNYDWGKFDKIPSASERKIIEEQKKREAEERLRNSE
jgi:hypothetical protein